MIKIEIGWFPRESVRRKEVLLFMEKEELIEEAKKLAAAPSCNPELREQTEKWMAAVGSSAEKAEAQKFLALLKECVTPIDGFIQFASSQEGEKILGGKYAAAKMLAAAEKHKNEGGKYCICPACQAGAVLLSHEAELLA